MSLETLLMIWIWTVLKFNVLNNRLSTVFLDTCWDISCVHRKILCPLTVSTIFVPDDHTLEIWYPFRVTKGELETAAFLAQSPPGTLGHHTMIPNIVSGASEMPTARIHSFTDECRSEGETTKIFDADGTELSSDGLLKKYYINQYGNTQIS